MTLTAQPETGYRRPQSEESETMFGTVQNVGQGERWIAGAAGAGLVGLGLARRTLPGFLVAATGGALLYRAFSGYCPMYGALGIDTTNTEGGARPEQYFDHGIHVEESFTIERSAEELYRFWRDLTNLPKFMYYLDHVEVLDDRRSHWVAKGPAGKQVEWDAEIINDEPNALIAWRSLENATVDNAGSVRFIPAPGDRGTEVRVVLDYIPPAGKVGKIIAQLFGREPSQEIKEDLRRFKQVMEAGEVPTTEGQPRGQCI